MKSDQVNDTIGAVHVIMSIVHLFFFVFQLEMIGYDISWGAFNIIEVMSSPKFTHKVRSIS